MKPTLQTKFSLFKSDGTRLTYGNCLVACIASLLEVSIDEVPNIYTFYGLKDGTENIFGPLWLQALNIWLKLKYNLNMVKVEAPINLNGAEFVEWLKHLKSKSAFDYVIARGHSMRDNPHCILISLNNRPSWDPHLSSEGLKSIDYYYKLVKIEPYYDSSHIG